MLTPNTYAVALAKLPADAKLSTTFGWQGEENFTQFFHQPDGTRWAINNGPSRVTPVWSCEKLRD